MYISKKIVFISFYLSIMVMFIHGINVHLYESVNDKIVFIEMFLKITFERTVVPLFFVISGFLFWNNMPKIWKNFWGKYIQKLRRRVKTLVIPYFLWNLIYYCIFALMLLIPCFSNLMQTDSVSFSLQEIELAVLFHKYNGVYWYVYHLIIFAIISPILLGIIKRKIGIIITMLVLLISNIYILFPVAVWGIHVDALAFWMIGGWIAVNDIKYWEKRNPKIQVIISVLIYIILALICYFLRPVSDNLLVKIFISFAYLYDSFLLWHIFDFFKGNDIKEYMSLSFWIYTAHPLLVDGLKKMLVLFLPHSSFFIIFNYFICIFIPLVILIIAGLWGRKKFPVLWRILMGDRGKKI